MYNVNLALQLFFDKMTKEEQLQFLSDLVYEIDTNNNLKNSNLFNDNDFTDAFYKLNKLLNNE